MHHLLDRIRRAGLLPIAKRRIRGRKVAFEELFRRIRPACRDDHQWTVEFDPGQIVPERSIRFGSVASIRGIFLVGHNARQNCMNFAVRETSPTPICSPGARRQSGSTPIWRPDDRAFLRVD